MTALSTRTPVGVASGTLVPLAEALDALAASVRARRVAVSPAEAVGCVLAADVGAPEDVPSRAVAERSGFACASIDLVGAAHHSPAFLSGAPTRVTPGTELPPGCDCVIPADGVSDFAGMAAASIAAAPGEGVRRAAEDARGGEVLVQAGTRLSASAAAALAACGVESLAVLQVTLVVDPACERLLPLLRALAPAAGWAVKSTEEDEVASGGMRIAATQGAGLGEDEGPGIALTGCFEIGLSPRGLVVPARAPALLPLIYGLLLPLAERVAGVPSETVTLPSARRIVSSVGVADLVLLERRGDVFEPLATGAVPLSALARATHRAVLPPESEGLPAGALIEGFPL